MPHCLQARCFSVSASTHAANGASVSGGEDTKPSVSTPAAPARAPATRVFWAHRPGAQGSAKVVTSAADVGDLVKEIKKKLELSAPLDSIKLQLVAEDKDGKLLTPKGKDGDPLPVPLNNMDTINKALENAAGKTTGRAIEDTDTLRIIVDVAAPAPAKPIACELCLQRAAHAATRPRPPRFGVARFS
jgi:hypothetical protein